MKYLYTYNERNISKNNLNTEQYIRDICLELVDNNFQIEFFNSIVSRVICITKQSNGIDNNPPFYLDEVREYALTIKSYLADSFKSADIYVFDASMSVDKLIGWDGGVLIPNIDLQNQKNCRISIMKIYYLLDGVKLPTKY